jgi:hypothetical protein
MALTSAKMGEELSSRLQVITDYYLAWQLQAAEYQQRLLSRPLCFLSPSTQSIPYHFQKSPTEALSFTLISTPGDGDCFFHAVNQPGFDRETLVRKLLECSADEAVRRGFAHEIRQFLYLGHTGTKHPGREDEACRTLLTRGIQPLFATFSAAEEPLRHQVGLVRTKLGEDQTKGKKPEELLRLLETHHPDLAPEFNRTHLAVLEANDAIYHYCCQESVFREYVELYLRAARGYIPFSRDFGTGTATTIDVINRLFGFEIQVYLLRDRGERQLQLANQPQTESSICIPIFHNGVNHFWRLDVFTPPRVEEAAKGAGEREGRDSLHPASVVAAPSSKLDPSEEIKTLKALINHMINVWPDRERIKNNLKIASANDDDLVDDPGLITSESMMMPKIPDQVRALIKDKPLCESILDECILEKERSITEKGVTDFDRLDDAFNALIQQGIFCVHNIPETPSSCWLFVQKELTKYKERRKTSSETIYFDPESIWAVAFYHFQDTARAEKSRQLAISYIAIADGEQERIDTVKAKFLIMATFKSFGLNVINPSFDSETKVFLPINWLVSLKRVSEMKKNRGMAVDVPVPRNTTISLSLEEYKKTIKSDSDDLDKQCIYFIDKLLDLEQDKRIEANAKRTFVLQCLKDELDEFGASFAAMPDRVKKLFESVIAMSKFGLFALQASEGIQKMAKIFNVYQKTKYAIPIIESLFNSRTQSISLSTSKSAAREVFSSADTSVSGVGVLSMSGGHGTQPSSGDDSGGGVGIRDGFVRGAPLAKRRRGNTAHEAADGVDAAAETSASGGVAVDDAHNDDIRASTTAPGADAGVLDPVGAS